MILSFADKQTQQIFDRKRVKQLPSEILDRAYMRLVQIHAACNLDTLKLPSSNRLKSLEGDLKGFYSIRINQQWRIVFRFEGGNARDVQITDYH